MKALNLSRFFLGSVASFGMLAFTGVNARADGTTRPDIYDLAPASANAAAAESTYKQSIANLNAAIAKVRHDFITSPQYVTAANEMKSAQQTFDLVRSTDIAALAQSADYRDLVAKRTEIDLRLKDSTLDSQPRVDLASEKLTYSSQISAMETAALADDPQYGQAQARLNTAREALMQMVKKFEIDLPTMPEIAQDKQAMDSAKTDRDAADAYLKAAYLARSDTIDANLLNNSNTEPAWSGYSYSFGNVYGLDSGYGTIIYGSNGTSSSGSTLSGSHIGPGGGTIPGPAPH